MDRNSTGLCKGEAACDSGGESDQLLNSSQADASSYTQASTDTTGTQDRSVHGMQRKPVRTTTREFQESRTALVSILDKKSPPSMPADCSSLIQRVDALSSGLSSASSQLDAALAALRSAEERMELLRQRTGLTPK